ncbi:MAG TPA: class I SAM-dependent methyltransferase [Candidatus Saccharimonadales bacterium]|nr:class I SAM-dependent methyltransferase [Candidatus Saccharimonadales bacterium]
MTELFPEVSRGQEAYYDALAATYDQVAMEVEWRPNDILRPFLQVHCAPVRSFLDLGAGTGQTIQTVLEYAQPERIVAVDTSQSMLDQLAQKPFGSRITSLRSPIKDYVKGPGETFDLVVSVGVFEHIPYFDELFDPIVARLNPGGRLAFTYEPILPEVAEQREAVYHHTVRDGNAGFFFTMFRSPEDWIMDGVQASGLTVVDAGMSAAYRIGSRVVQYGFVGGVKP